MKQWKRAYKPPDLRLSVYVDNPTLVLWSRCCMESTRPKTIENPVCHGLVFNLESHAPVFLVQKFKPTLGIVQSTNKANLVKTAYRGWPHRESFVSTLK